MLTPLLKGVKIIKTFLVELRISPISKKFEMALMVFSGAWWKVETVS
jgi:hypothetical protein